MRRLDLSLQELGSAKLLVYNGDIKDLNNSLKHTYILPFKRATFVDVPICYFDLSELVPLSEIQKYTLDKYDLLNMIKVSANVVSYCTTQNIDTRAILFDPKYVFVDGKFNTYFLPLKTGGEDNDYKAFLKNLIVNSVIDPLYKDNFVQLLLNIFNDPSFSVDSLIKITEQMLSNSPVDFRITTKPIRNTPNENIPEVQPQGPILQTAPNLLEQPVKTTTQPTNKSESYPVNTFPNPYQSIEGNLVTQIDPNLDPILSQTPQPVVQTGPVNEAYLISEEDQENHIQIDSPEFAIGRNPEIVNLPINSPFVGRMHAKISYRDGEYYVADKSSTNGTFLNNQKLQPEQEQLLKSGDIIRLAKHSFQFNIRQE